MLRYDLIAVISSDKVFSWTDIHDGEMVTVVLETDPTSLQRDRYACTVRKITERRGVLVARLVTVGHVPLEIRYVITSSQMVVKYPELLKIRNHAVRSYPQED